MKIIQMVKIYTPISSKPVTVKYLFKSNGRITWRREYLPPQNIVTSPLINY